MAKREHECISFIVCVRGFHNYFSLGNIDGFPRKPDPSIVFKALSICPTPKAQTLYVGDSGVDIETARRACVESCGVTWGYRSINELKDAYADHIVSTPAQIADIVFSEK